MNRVVVEITVGEQLVQVRELTVAEIRAWLAGKAALGDLVDSALFEDFSVTDLAVLTNLPAAEIDNLTPRQIKSVMAKAQEVNPDFFAMRARMVTMGRGLLEMNGSPTLNEASPA